MQRYKNKIIPFLMIIVIFVNTLISSSAATNVSVSVINNPKIDVVVTMKDTTLDLTNFENDIRNRLQEKGINTENINFITVNREQTELNADGLSFEKAVNEWTVVGAPGWYATSDNGIMMSVLGAHTENARGSIMNTCYYYGSNNYKNYNWANSQGSGIVTTDANGKQLTGRALMKKISSQVKSSGFLGTGYTVGWTSALIQELPLDTTELHVSFDVSNNSNLHNGFCFNVSRRDNPSVSADGGNEDNLTGYFFNLTRHYDSNNATIFYTGNSAMWVDPEIDAVSTAQTINTYNMNTWSKNGYGASNSTSVNLSNTWPNFLYYVNDGDFDAPFGASGVSGDCAGNIYRGTKIAQWSSPRTTQQYYTATSVNHYDVDVSNGHVKITLGGRRDSVENGFGVIGGRIVAEFDIPAGNNQGGSFGFYGINCERACSMKITNFVALTQRNYVKTYKDVLTEPTWREDAKHVVVNVDNNTDETLTGTDTIGEILSRTLEDQIHFIQWGTDTNKALTTNFIARNDNRGIFTYNSNYNQAIEDTANYIKGLIEQEQETQTVIVGQPTTLIVSPAEYKTNAVSTDFPNGRWKIEHNETYYDNNTGKEDTLITPNLDFTFNKPGKYTIYFDNKSVKDVYAHRKPIADFDIGLTNGTVTLDSTSYDLDSNIDKGYGKGIAEESWYHKEATATSWTPGKITKYTGGIYMIRLDVTDNQGATSSAIKYIGTGSPVAKFTYLNNPVGKYKTLEIKNTSYDPYGYEIKSYNWVLKKGALTIGTYTTQTPKVTFKDLDIGNYSYTLTVTNINDVSSEPYTNSFTIIDDIDKPEISVTPTSCTWKGSQIANVTVTDPESGFGKFRYIATLSETFPSSDAAWSNWITSNPSTATVTGNTTGEYYLHIEAYDAAGNLATKTVGKYQIDKTPPNVTKITESTNGVNKTNITVAATDPLSGMYQYAISTTATQPSTFQSSNVLSTTQLGTHYIWTKDVAGNVSYTTYNVTELDFAITTSCGTQGVISNYSVVSSYKGTSISIIPATGFKIKDVIVDGASIGAVSNCDFWNVTTNHTVVATFERDTKITTILNNLKTKYDWITFK